MIVDPPQKQDSEEPNILSSYFSISRGNQSNEVIYRMVLTHILKCWEDSKTQSYPRFYAMNPPENISRKVCCIILKYYYIQ